MSRRTIICLDCKHLLNAHGAEGCTPKWQDCPCARTPADVLGLLRAERLGEDYVPRIPEATPSGASLSDGTLEVPACPQI